MSEKCQEELVSYLPEWKVRFFPHFRVTKLRVTVMIMNAVYITCFNLF
jgi:hypothetical protein